MRPTWFLPTSHPSTDKCRPSLDCTTAAIFIAMPYFQELGKSSTPSWSLLIRRQVAEAAYSIVLYVENLA